jgi:hypothetical protein
VTCETQHVDAPFTPAADNTIHSRVIGYEDEGCFRCSQS